MPAILAIWNDHFTKRNVSHPDPHGKGKPETISGWPASAREGIFRAA